MEAITREEKFLAAAAGNGNSIPVPVTRVEKFLEAMYDRVSMGGITQEQLQEAVDDYFGRNPLEGEFVKTVNGKAPDARGNVQIETGGGAGLTSAQINALDGMFKVCAYDESKDYVSAYAAFKSAFGLSGSGGGGEEPEPETPTTYSILNTLTNVTSSNTAVSATGGNPYFATLTPADGHTIDSVVVTMGGVDISATAVNGAEISISSVTGNIVIIATAAENQAQPVEMTNVYMYGTATIYSDGGDTEIGSKCETLMSSANQFDVDTIIDFEFTTADVQYMTPVFGCVESPTSANGQTKTVYYAEIPTQAELGSSNSSQLPAGETWTYTYTVKAGYYLFVGWPGNVKQKIDNGSLTITGKAV